MKKTFLFALVAMMALCTMTMPACCVNFDGDDDFDDSRFFSESYSGVSEHRDVAPFSRVKVSHALTVNIVQGEDQSVIVKADDSVIDKIMTEVHDGVLRVYVDDNWFKKTFKNKYHKVIVDVVVPELTALDASGASDVKASGFKNENFTVKASGASNVIIDNIVVSGVTSFDASGASHVKANGESEKVIIRSSGASDVSSRYFEASIADVSASGASDVDVTANDEIRVDCSGASDVDYYGHPKIVDVKTSGASDVSRH
jgi:hypothetical protein